MPTTNQEPPAYTTHLYEVCDIYDVVAGSRGNIVADAAVQRLLRQVVKDYPRAAESALGKGKAATYLAVYKATDEHPGDIALSAACDAQGDDKIIALLQWAAQAPAEHIDELLRVATAPAAQPTTKLADSGKMSKKAYEPATDVYAIQFDADQAKPERMKR